MRNSAGFIALTSVLILSAIFLSVTVGMASRAITSAFLTTAFIERDKAEQYGRGCIEYALIELQRTVNYAGNDTIVIGGGNCRIRAISGTGPTLRTLQVESTVGETTYRAEVVVDAISPEVQIDSYERVTQF